MKLILYGLISTYLLFFSVTPTYSIDREVAVVYFENLSDEKWDWLSTAINYTLTDNLKFVKNLSLAHQKDVRRIVYLYSETDIFEEEDYILFGKKINTKYLLFGEFLITKGNRTSSSSKGQEATGRRHPAQDRMSESRDVRELEITIKMVNSASKKLILTYTLKKSLDQFTSHLRTITEKVVSILLKNPSNSNIFFEKKTLSLYTKHNPKTIPFLYFFTKAWINSLQPNNSAVLYYCKQALIHSPNDLNTLLLAAKTYFLRSEYPFAMKYYKMAFKLAKKWTLRQHLSQSAHEIARLYNMLGYHKKALKLYRKIVKLNKEVGDQFRTAKTHNLIGILLKSKSEYDHIYAYYHRAYQIFSYLENAREKAFSLRLIGSLYYAKGEYKKANEYYLLALKIHKSKALQENILKDYLFLGDLEKVRGHYDKSLKLYFRALKMAKFLSLRFSQADAYQGIAAGYDILGDDEKALVFIKNSLDIRKTLNDLRGIAKVYSQLGLLHYNKSRYQKALIIHKKALKLNSKLGLKKAMARDYTNIGMIYNIYKNYDTAQTYYEKALTIRKKLDDKIGVAFTKNSFALIYLNRDRDFDRALSIYKNSLQYMIGADYKEGIALTYWMIGIIYEKKQHYKQAIDYYKKSRDIFLELENTNYNNLQSLINRLKRKE